MALNVTFATPGRRLRRATIIVLGDARTNGRQPRDDSSRPWPRAPRGRSGSTPSRACSWNYGDSVIEAYERHCHAFECWTTRRLEELSPDAAGVYAATRR